MGSQAVLPLRLGIHPPSYNTAYTDVTSTQRRQQKKVRLSLCGQSSSLHKKQRGRYSDGSCGKEDSDSEEEKDLKTCDSKPSSDGGKFSALPPIKGDRCDASSQPYSKHYREYIGPNPLALPCYSSDCREDLNKFTYQKKSGEFYCSKRSKPQELFILDSCDPPQPSAVEDWQLAPAASWDRMQSRNLTVRFPSTLPDNKRQIVKPLLQRKPKPGEWIEPDEELKKLIKEDRIHKDLQIRIPGYTGMRLKNPGSRCMTIKREDSQETRYNEEVYKSSSHLVHRPLPSKRPTENTNDQPISGIVTLLWPYNPCRYKAPKRVGKWENLPPHWIW